MAKIVVILGPTGAGKSSLAIKLAKKFQGEVVSADSRQVYKRLRIGSNAVTKKEADSIKHHLLGLVEPQKNFSVHEFQKLAFKKITEIEKRKHVPFLVGGTGYYLDAVAENKILPETKTNRKLRQKLEGKTPKQLFAILKKLNPERAAKIDQHNPRRLIRAVEIARSVKPRTARPQPENHEIIFIGVWKPAVELKRAISQRFIKWLEDGFLLEVEKLINLGLPRKKFKEFGLHYWCAYLFLKKELKFKDFWDNSLKSLWQYAKRQNTWFKRNQRIHWIKNEKQAEKLIKKFLKN